MFSIRVLQGDTSSPDFFNQKRAVSGALSRWAGM
jgi:hypothetical protein